MSEHIFQRQKAQGQAWLCCNSAMKLMAFKLCFGGKSTVNRKRWTCREKPQKKHIQGGSAIVLPWTTVVISMLVQCPKSYRLIPPMNNLKSIYNVCVCDSPSYLFRVLFTFTVFCYLIMIELLLFLLISPLEAYLHSNNIIFAYCFCLSELDIQTKLFVLKDDTQGGECVRFLSDQCPALSNRLPYRVLHSTSRLQWEWKSKSCWDGAHHWSLK